MNRGRRGVTSNTRYCAKALARWEHQLTGLHDGGCRKCKFFVPSTGKFSIDVGVCANRSSPRHALATTEAYGCEARADSGERRPYEERAFFEKVHEEWVKLRPHPDGWAADQCGACCFFIVLDGAFMEDWGMCSNPDSQCDARAMFEHEGCEAFVRNTLGWGGATPRRHFERQRTKRTK